MKTNYAAIIPYKVKDIIELIMENKKESFLDAINYLYDSKLYEYLSNEKSKFWHFSSNKLFDLLNEEKQNSFFKIPDVV